jgi:pectinesterase
MMEIRQLQGMKRRCIALLLSTGAVFASAAGDAGDTVIVDRNGRGHFRNVGDAIESLRAFDPKGRTTIFIREGVYKEKLVLPAHACNVKIVGESRDRTIITYDDHANIDRMGTFRTYTFLIRGNDIELESLTVENTALPLGQAVALHVEGDRIIFRNCRFLGNQDTVYTGRPYMRQYFENCYIEGTTDFIFGPSTCWFEGCEIHGKRRSYLTAASTPADVPFGYIFHRCRITLAPDLSGVYLGRPWRPHAMTLFMHCTLPSGIHPAGWHNWDSADNEKTARYMEYGNICETSSASTSPATSRRAAWSKMLTAEEAAGYMLEHVMQGCDGWVP